jgi:hypothetical protein
MMKRLVPVLSVLAVVVLAACEGTRVRMFNTNPPGTPAYFYEDAFYGLKRDHELFQRLQGAPAGQQSAVVADIVKALETMRDLLEEPFRTEIQPFIDAHRKVKVEFTDRGAVNAGVFMTMKDLQQKVDAGFYPEKVKLKAVAAAPAAVPATAPAVGTSPAPAGATPVVAPASAPAVPGWMAVAAWRKAHEDLVAAWPDKPADAAAAFAKAREALGLVKAGASEDSAPQCQIYLNEYDRLAGQTATFSKVPEGQTAEGVKKALAAVGKGVEAYLPKQ